MLTSDISPQMTRNPAARGLIKATAAPIRGAFRRTDSVRQYAPNEEPYAVRRPPCSEQYGGPYSDTNMEELFLTRYSFCLKRSMKSGPFTLRSVKPSSVWGERIQLYHILFIAVWQGRNLECTVPYITEAVSQACGDRHDEVSNFSHHYEICGIEYRADFSHNVYNHGW
jgi:hypothetical protein